MSARAGNLVNEVHTLASRYHWAERDILTLRLHRRRAYLALIEQEADRALVAGLLGAEDARRT
ncbi:hypothetical protein [Bradyrhizobium sp.]|jgi:hypothetical protein|uniref:hypothetical protein n=1 Tax=Bradyrhizobium sp. TaxID=376 RepID=UPI002E09308E|nr:hypothetical protein [Bradyrhizobium sp.]